MFIICDERVLEIDERVFSTCNKPIDSLKTQVEKIMVELLEI